MQLPKTPDSLVMESGTRKDKEVEGNRPNNQATHLSHTDGMAGVGAEKTRR